MGRPFVFPDRGLDRRDALNLLLVLSLALFTRFYRLADASFWADEVFTLKFASLPWSTLWISAYEATPPLYYSIIRPVMDMAGTSEWWVRMPSAVAGVLTVCFVYLSVKKIADSRAALAATLLLTLSAANIEYGQEARAYALVGLWMAVSFLGLACLNARWRSDTEGVSFSTFLTAGGALYAIGVLGALYSHNVAVFYWLGAQFFFLGWWYSPFRFSRNLAVWWFVVNLVVLVLWVPWFLASLQVIESDMFSWLSQYEAPAALRIWRDVNAVETGYPIDPFVGIVILLLAIRGWLSLRGNPAMAAALLAMVVCSSVVIWAYGFFGGPIFMRRSVLWGSMFSFMLAGIGISRLPLLVGRSVLLALACIGLLAFYNYSHYHRAENTDWRSPAGVLNQQAGANDVFLFRTTWHAPALLHYLDEDQSGRRVLGWSCTQRQPFFGRVENVGEHFARVAWSSGNPGWREDNLTAATVWVIEGLCYDSVSIDLSDNWLRQNWIQARSFGFKGVTLHQWVPKAAVQGVPGNDRP